MWKRLIASLIILTALAGGFFYFRYQVYFSHGRNTENQTFEIIKGEGNGQVAAKLEQAGLVSGNWYFYYYLRTHGLVNKILPGKYALNGNMVIPEIAVHITSAENILPGYVKITIPEGWTSKKIAERLAANGLDGEGFLEIVQNPDELSAGYGFLDGAATLEGYLFPDTYFFKKDITAGGIIEKMLDNFNKRLTPEMRAEIGKQNKPIADIITMASIVEREVGLFEDRELVSGLFWNRIAIGQPLQSDATLTYILDDEIGQHTLEQTMIDSPYNTYRNKGLPPGPIANPGLAAIKATLYPKNSEYNYFLSDPKTGRTIFSKTFEEHVSNKGKYGL
ncbi:MAG: endolytic transglycosylase MltG [Parcubacteria group bacterium]